MYSVAPLNSNTHTLLLLISKPHKVDVLIYTIHVLSDLNYAVDWRFEPISVQESYKKEKNETKIIIIVKNSYTKKLNCK